MSKLKFETLQIHAGYERSENTTKSRAIPIYQTTAYEFNSVEHGENLFALKENGHIYTRISNPTTQILEDRMNALEGGVGALAVASGMAATTYVVLNATQAGDEIISSKNIYGGTYNLFKNTIKEFGITCHFFDPDDLNSIELLINEKTKLIFIESIGNPNADLIDFKKIKAICQKHQIPLVIDNTFSPYIFKPIEHGADIVVYSATKFLGGHGNSMGGIVVDAGTFNWKNEKFPGFVNPDPSYNNIIYSDLGKSAFIVRMRVRVLRDTGACISPFNSFLILQGIETLSLRIERHIENTKKIIDFLANHPKISVINHPDYEKNKYHDLQKEYFPFGCGSIFTIEINGGFEEAKRVIENVTLFSHLTNVADVRSLIVHSASTTHSQLGKEALANAGIKENTIRLSIGLEHADDLIEDLAHALSFV